MATERVVLLDVERADGEPLPEHSAGAHIDVQLDQWGTGRLVRQYSLCGVPGDRSRYRIAVLRDPASRGGSEAVHRIRVGNHLPISPPRNNFPLAAASRHHLFAGGIGVTPLLSMAQHLDATGSDYTFDYCARSAGDVVFSELVCNHPRVRIHLDDGPDHQRMVLSRDLSVYQPDSAVYVCGPAPFIDHVVSGAYALGWPADAVHTERFSPTALPITGDDEFTVRLSSTGAEYTIGPTETVLDVLVRHGVEARSSCQLGICGECVVNVLAGEPDHRDDVLSDDEHAAGQFTPCCSRSRTTVLELDL
ncbi:oxidoreductase [Rhodococcus enclensis]|nr:oxidoreductase [Rhodococcus qingshengii]